MKKNNRRYNVLFGIFLFSVLLSFYFSRPLNSPNHPFIGGDGLGYYSYLPATFIYNDADYEFAWFTEVHNRNYTYSAFEKPEDNLLVEYDGKRINKYYPGLSFIWLPFFTLAHIIAEPAGFAPDGYSLPYQWSIGVASLVYLCLGLWYLRRLILRLTGDHTAALVVPAAIYFGSYLFLYATATNAWSHVYSFSFLTICVYYAQRFFATENKQLKHFLLCFFCLTIAVFIRPFTGLIVLIFPAFIPDAWALRNIRFEHFRWSHGLILLLTGTVLFYCTRIVVIQTGTLIPYTYTNERFYFADARFFDALFSYHNGLFLYAPLFFVALLGIPFLKGRQRILLPVVFFLIVFLYSAWWFWPIVRRAAVDFYLIPAIMLGAVIHRSKGAGRAVLLAVIALTVVYHQFRQYQVRNGILTEYSTYGEMFWRNFFRTHRTNMYPIDPASVKFRKLVEEGFESGHKSILSSDRKYEGDYSLLLDSVNYIADLASVPYPDLHDLAGFRKLRFSFRVFFDEGISSMHAFIKLVDAEGRSLKEVPFYLNANDIFPGQWDHKEFGFEAGDEINEVDIDHVVFLVWNVEAKNRIYIDDAKFEIIVTEKSFEAIPVNR